MDEINEIEEISTRIVEDYLELLKPFVQQIERLNTRVKELEDARLLEAQRGDHWIEKYKELEEDLTVLQDHANGLGEIIHNQTKIRIGLEGELTVANERIKELEERQKWINEVARPDHPDDERPWCAAYLDCRARTKELEEEVASLRESRDSWKVAYREGGKVGKNGT